MDEIRDKLDVAIESRDANVRNLAGAKAEGASPELIARIQDDVNAKNWEIARLRAKLEKEPKIWNRIERDYRTGEVYLVQIRLGDDPRSPVEVYPPRERFGKMGGAKVNWSALGSQDPKDARIFMQMLERGITIAEGLDNGFFR